MKLLFENWRKHLQEQELNELRNQILNEISDEDYELIKRWMRDAPEEAYSFRNLFGGKKRIAIPVETGAADGPIGEIMRFFEDSGWKINFKDSTVSKEFTKTIPKGPRAGEEITQTKKMRIGKALNLGLKLLQDYEKAAKAAMDSRAMAADIAALATGIPDDDPETSKINQIKDEAAQKLKDAFPEAADWPGANVKRLPKLIEFWNEKSEFYRQNPEAAFQQQSPYVTILSRHPVDVVRMSDINNIRSCHSRTGGYFQCAVAESRGHGPIAYLVPREQFEQYFDVDLSETDPSEVDLDQGDEEIFEDDDRGIPGLRPVGRVRLRKFVSNEDGRMITAPERRTYAPGGGRTPPLFLKGVTDWALNSQKNVIGDPAKLAQEFYDEDWVRHGGHYEDTDDGEVMARMLEPVLDDKELLRDLEQAGKMPQELEDEDEIERELEEGSLSYRAQRVQEEANNRLRNGHFSVHHEIEPAYDYDDGEYLQFYGHFGVNLDDELGDYVDEEPDNPFPLGWASHEDEINDAFKQALDQEAYIYVNDEGEVDTNNNYSLHIVPAHDEYPNLEGFESFASSLVSADENFERIMNNVRDQLTEEGLIKPSSEVALQTLKGLDNLNGAIDSEEKLVRVTWKKRNKISTDLQEFKRFSAVDQDTIKQLWAREFRNHVGEILNKLRKKFNFPLPNIILRSDRQKLSPELDGIYGILDFDLRFDDENQLRLAAKLIEELNKSSYQMSMRQRSAYEYYDLLKDAIDQEPPFQSDEQSEPASKKLPPSSNYVPPPEGAVGWEPPKESKKSKISDKMLFESWRRYLDK